MSYDKKRYLQEIERGQRSATGAARLKELSGKHLRAINMHLAGCKGKEIAVELDMTEAWVSTVLNDPLAVGEIRQRFVDVDNEMYAKATGRIEASMDSIDEALALRAAEMVWRARGRFAEKAPINTTAEDVVARMLELAGATGSASVTVSATAGPRPDESNAPPTIEGREIGRASDQ